jgi:heme/copper-type cytochrome/quinol oxidase subunit 2
MPVAVEVVSKEKFAEWVAEAQAKFARVDRPTARMAKTEIAD